MSEELQNILEALLWFLAIGGGLGFLLAIAARAFQVKKNPLADEVLDCLPGANCGGCGYAGCSALANAIAEGAAPKNACTVGGDETAAKIYAVFGEEPETTGKRLVAQVMCAGNNELTEDKYIYDGLNSCISANALGGGPKACRYGCLGLGTCVSVCKFDAISIVSGVATVDREKCTHCGLCVSACPKNLIELIPYDAPYYVACSSADKGVNTKNSCKIGCMGCRLCEKNCEAGAITVTDYKATIDYDKCTGCGKCAEVCTRKIIFMNPNCRKNGADAVSEAVFKGEEE